ncbi:MAG: 16S rRNA (uracil(1498)-N(3))-methyltransferase [Bacteroidota bacterium]|nr:16S rRNA (uracil(1498)-N(3))-methyltransferase [Bacteroidota bacterium]
MQLFYSKHIAKEITLNNLESHHAIKVLRLKKASSLNLTDGNGYLYTGRIVDPNSRRCKIDIIKRIKKNKIHNYYLHIGISPTKNIDRFEWFLEKATEIGVDQITPIITKHSERKTIKEERCEKIIISAMKQSLKFYQPKLNPICNFKDFVEKIVSKNKYIAHCHKSQKRPLKNISNSEDSIIIIGPEGDFSKDEIKMALKYKYKAVSLGNNRLRTETAGIVATHTISIIN